MRSTKARMLAGTTFLAPLTLIAKVNAGEVRVCAIVANPGSFDHQTLASAASF